MEYKNIVGLITPETLRSLEASDFETNKAIALCDILEIRYDLFQDKFSWKDISSKVKYYAKDKLQLGTIRLTSDGGNYESSYAKKRLNDWKEILLAKDTPHILDIEYDNVDQFNALYSMAKERNVDILLSLHDFNSIPDEEDLESIAQIAKYLHASGVKIAAMSETLGDTTPLYKFSLKHGKEFKYMASFAMGETGKASRILTLQKGGNLTYGSIGKTQAPGQIAVPLMRQIFKKIPRNASETLIFDLLGENPESNNTISAYCGNICP